MDKMWLKNSIEFETMNQSSCNKNNTRDAILDQNSIYNPIVKSYNSEDKLNKVLNEDTTPERRVIAFSITNQEEWNRVKLVGRSGNQSFIGNIFKNDKPKRKSEQAGG